MSSQVKIVALVLVGLVVVGGGYFIFKSNQTVGLVNESETITKAGDSKKIPFSEFIKIGGSYKCTINQSIGGVDTQGLTYLNNKMIRGEYNTKVQGVSIDTTLIVRDGFTYTWTSMAPTMGFKAKVADQKVVDNQTGTSGTYSFNAEQIGDYDCQTWNSDDSKFVLPTGVTFREV
ncbi:MAG: hypothetical protein K8Q91_01310 [Candidatus Vogelbacteria bacterium]|nr:hypothetical protein [Candidatus Vogelbacteria bacterium]